MNPGEKEPPITKEMHFETFFPLFVSTYLSKEKLSAYIMEHHSSFDYPTLIEFFQSEPIKNELNRSWDSQRKSQHSQFSTPKKVTEQTINDMLDAVKGIIAEHIAGKKTIFENQPMEKIRQAQKIIFFYERYFRQKFHGESPHLVP